MKAIVFICAILLVVSGAHFIQGNVIKSEASNTFPNINIILNMDTQFMTNETIYSRLRPSQFILEKMSGKEIIESIPVNNTTGRITSNSYKTSYQCQESDKSSTLFTIGASYGKPSGALEAIRFSIHDTKTRNYLIFENDGHEVIYFKCDTSLGDFTVNVDISPDPSEPLVYINGNVQAH
eukprot:Nk52_evm88s2192 gene=Nk52_evmTU88s2192